MSRSRVEHRGELVRPQLLRRLDDDDPRLVAVAF